MILYIYIYYAIAAMECCYTMYVYVCMYVCMQVGR